MNVENLFNQILFEEEKRIVPFGEIVDILINTLPRIHIEEIRGQAFKWGVDEPIPFDYGELPDLINPADNMGWDVIISPDADKNHKFLRITGYVKVKDNANLIPPPNGNKPGNHKLILGQFGKTSNKSMTILKDWFEKSKAFDVPTFIHQNSSNMYHHVWKRKKSELTESQVMYYAGTSTNNKVKDKLKIWNKEPIIVTADVNEARDIAKDVCRRNGGNPVIYKVQPMGKMLPVHDNSSVTFIVDTASVVGELEESWENATFGSYKLGHVNDGRWGGVAVGPTAKKSFNALKENLDNNGNRAKSYLSKILNEEERDSEMKYRIFCDMDGVIVGFTDGFKEKFKQSPLSSKITLLDSNNIEKQIEDYFISIAKSDSDKKSARHRAKAYFWAIIPGLDVGLKKRKTYTKDDWDKYTERSLSFWENLEWLHDGGKNVGKELWDYLVDLKNSGKISELNILSSPSSDVNIPIFDEYGNIIKEEKTNLAERGKKAWISKHAEVANNVDNVIIKTAKYEESTGPYDILIDDTPKKIFGDDKKKGWEDAEGTGVLYVNLSDTIEKLKELGL